MCVVWTFVHTSVLHTAIQYCEEGNKPQQTTFDYRSKISICSFNALLLFLHPFIEKFVKIIVVCVQRGLWGVNLLGRSLLGLWRRRLRGGWRLDCRWSELSTHGQGVREDCIHVGYWLSRSLRHFFFGVRGCSWPPSRCSGICCVI